MPSNPGPATLREKVEQLISFAIQGVREYNSKDIDGYYENRQAWVSQEGEAIMQLFESTMLEVVGEDEEVIPVLQYNKTSNAYRNKLRMMQRTRLSALLGKGES